MWIRAFSWKIIWGVSNVVHVLGLLTAVVVPHLGRPLGCNSHDSLHFLRLLAARV